ncbi:MAG: hypothetical protein WBI57_17380 [Desulfobacterales bacterium]
MEMIWNPRPAVTGRGGLLQNRTESFRNPVSIGIVFKNVSSLDTPAYNMMQGTRRLPAIANSVEAGGHLFRLDVAYDFIATKKWKKKRLNSTPSPFFKVVYLFMDVPEVPITTFLTAG